MIARHDAVILAAGGSRRLGRPKQLLTIGGETLIARVTRLVLATGPSRTLVVVGAHAYAMRAALASAAVEIIENDVWATGMASSLQAAARALGGRVIPILVSVVDQPALESRHFAALLAAHDENLDTVSAYGDALGVPAVINAPTLARATDPGGGGDVGFRRLWADTSPRSIRADELAVDLDDETDLNQAIAAGLLDPAGKPSFG